MVTNVSADRGTVSVENGVAVNYLPEPDYSGEVVVRVTVSDGELTAASNLIINVVAVNDAPVGRDDYYVVSEGSVDNVLDILANDTDIDGDTLTILSADAAFGVVSIEGNQVSYFPQPGTTGLDLVSYTILDEAGFSVSALASVDVVPAEGNSHTLEWVNPTLRLDGEPIEDGRIMSYAVELRNVETEELEILELDRAQTEQRSGGDETLISYEVDGLNSGFYEFSIQVVDDLGQLSIPSKTSAIRVGG